MIHLHLEWELASVIGSYPEGEIAFEIQLNNEAVGVLNSTWVEPFVLSETSAIWDVYGLVAADCVLIQALSSRHNSFPSRCVSPAPLWCWFPE